MKRFLYAAALLLGLSALFVSCNKDNSNDNIILHLDTYYGEGFDISISNDSLAEKEGPVTVCFHLHNHIGKRIVGVDIVGYASEESAEEFGDKEIIEVSQEHKIIKYGQKIHNDYKDCWGKPDEWLFAKSVTRFSNNYPNRSQFIHFYFEKVVVTFE